MGYTTDFEGAFELDRALSKEHYDYLVKFSGTRRMCRKASVAETFADPVRLAAKLPIGKDGEYYVGSESYAGQEQDASIVYYNDPPSTQPGLWCQWVPNADGTAIKWDGGEKFYEYVDWIQYLVKNFLKPWGYTLNGVVEWYGEDRADTGSIIIENNVVKAVSGAQKANEE